MNLKNFPFLYKPENPRFSQFQNFPFGYLYIAPVHTTRNTFCYKETWWMVLEQIQVLNYPRIMSTMYHCYLGKSTLSFRWLVSLVSTKRFHEFYKKMHWWWLTFVIIDVPFEIWNILDMELAMTNVDGKLGFSWVHSGLGKFKKNIDFCLGGGREKERFFWKLLKYYHKHALRESPPLLCLPLLLLLLLLLLLQLLLLFPFYFFQ